MSINTHKHIRTCVYIHMDICAIYIHSITRRTTIYLNIHIICTSTTNIVMTREMQPKQGGTNTIGWPRCWSNQSKPPSSGKDTGSSTWLQGRTGWEEMKRGRSMLKKIKVVMETMGGTLSQQMISRQITGNHCFNFAWNHHQLRVK